MTDQAAVARRIDVPQFRDPRGRLAAFERAQPLPFTPVRSFVITDVPPGAQRAQHAVSCDEFLWMIAGGCLAAVGAGAEAARQFQLMARGPGLYVPKGAWLGLSQFSPDGILLCLASAGYEARA